MSGHLQWPNNRNKISSYGPLNPPKIERKDQQIPVSLLRYAQIRAIIYQDNSEVIGYCSPSEFIIYYRTDFPKK